MPRVTPFAGGNRIETMTFSRAGVLSAAVVLLLAPSNAQSWSDRTERFDTWGSFADAGPQGVPLAIHDGHVHAWDGQAWDRLCDLPADLVGANGICFDRARREVIAILRTTASGANGATFRLDGLTWTMVAAAPAT